MINLLISEAILCLCEVVMEISASAMQFTIPDFSVAKFIFCLK